jgi:hypothetical protein
VFQGGSRLSQYSQIDFSVGTGELSSVGGEAGEHDYHLYVLSCGKFNVTLDEQSRRAYQ